MATIRELFVAMGVQIDDEGLEAFGNAVESAAAAMADAANRVQELENELNKLPAAFAHAEEAEEEYAEAFEQVLIAQARFGRATDEQIERLNETGAALDSARAEVNRLIKVEHDLTYAKAEATKAQERYNKAIEDQKTAEKLAKGLDRLQAGYETLSEGVQQLTVLLGASAAAAVAVGAAYVGLTTKVAEASEEILRSSDALGVSVERYQEYKFAFDALGASTDDMMDALGTITDRAKAALEGSKTYIVEFKRLGIEIQSLKNKKPGEIFDIYVKAASSATDQTEVLTSAVRLFGDDLGRRIMPALVGSEESFKNLFMIARSTGIVMNEDAVRAGRNLAVQMRATGAILQGLVNVFASKFAPTLQKILSKFNAFVQNMIQAGHVTRITNFLVEEGAKQFNKLVRMVEVTTAALGVNGMLGVLKALAAALGAVTIGLAGFAAFKIGAGLLTFLGGSVAAATVMLAKFIAIAAIIAGLIALAEDFWVYLQGGESVIGGLTEDSEWFKGVIDLLAENLRYLGFQLMDLWNSVGETLNAVFEILGMKGGSTLQTIARIVIGAIALLINAAMVPLQIFLRLTRVVQSAIAFVARFIADIVSGARKAEEVWDNFSFLNPMDWFNAISTVVNAVFEVIRARTREWFGEIGDLITTILKTGFITAINPVAGIGYAGSQVYDYFAGSAGQSAAGNVSNVSNTQANFEINVQAPPGTADPRAFGQVAGDETARRIARSGISSGRR